MSLDLRWAFFLTVAGSVAEYRGPGPGKCLSNRCLYLPVCSFGGIANVRHCPPATSQRLK
eukprot:7167105-Pyramimonas_sp.AAC.1